MHRENQNEFNQQQTTKNYQVNTEEEYRTPSFFVKKEIYEWIRTKKKTIELRRGNSRNGTRIAFLSSPKHSLKGKILNIHEGEIKELLNAENYKKIVPIAATLDEALSYVKTIYPSAEGTFTTYEFELE